MAIHMLVEVKLKEKNRGIPEVPIGVVVKLEGAAEKVLGKASTSGDGVAVVELTSGASPRELLALPKATAYAVAYDKKGKIAAKSKSITLRTAHPTLRIDVNSDLALDAGWLRSKEARPTAERVERRLREWDKANRSNPEPPVDVCLTRTLLDTLAGLHEPQSEFQKDVALRLHRQLAPASPRGSRRLTAADHRNPPKLDDKTRKIIKDLSAKAAEARDAISSYGLTASGTCDASGTAEGIAGNLLRSSPRFSQIMQALCDQDAPFVEEGLPQKAGEPWLTDFVWQTKCVQAYEQGTLRAPIAEMMRPYENPTTHQFATPKSLEPPRVKVVEVRDPIRRKIVRSTSDIGSGVIRATNFSGTEWNTEDWDMRVPLDDQRCVVKKAANPSAPAADQRQITAFDIVPGQTILIKGSGFITEKATVVLKRQAWALDPDEGRLVPQGPELPTVLPAGKDMVLVKGNTFPHMSWTADTYVGDAIVFEWPSEVTAEGLYTLSFRFENLKDAQGIPYVTSSQATSCEFTRPEFLETPALHFAMLKAVTAPVLKEPSLARVTCIDETNPEWPWYDSVSLLTDTTIERLLFDVSDPALCRPLPTEQLHNARGPEILDFWEDGEVHDPMMRLLPDGDATRALQLDELMAVLVSGDELFDPTARLILKVALSAILIAVMLLVTAVLVTIVIAIGFAVLIGYLFVAAIVTTVTGGVAAGAFAAAAAVTGSLFVFLGPVVVALWASVLIGGIAAINLFVDHIPGTRSMFRMGTTVHGMELALKRSPYRFHHRLWPVGRVQESTSDMSLVDSSITPEEFKETYGAQPLGGDYRIELKMPFQR